MLACEGNDNADCGSPGWLHMLLFVASHESEESCQRHVYMGHRDVAACCACLLSSPGLHLFQ